MEMLFKPAVKSDKADTPYYVVLAGLPYKSAVAMIPANRAQLEGWLGASAYRKRVKQRAIRDAVREELRELTPEEFSEWERLQVAVRYGQNGNGDAARQGLANLYEKIGYSSILEEVERRWRAEISLKAEHIMDEVTSDGLDSLLPSDYRFKTTRNGYVYCGAGNVKRMAKEAAYDVSGDVSIMRWLGERMWISPGKIVYHEPLFYGGGLRYRPLTIGDVKRYESTIPPESRGPKNLYRGKLATIFYSQRIPYPWHLRFCLWASSEIEERTLGVWFEVGGTHGLGGARSMEEGQFVPLLLRRLTKRETERLLELEAQKNVGAFRPDNPDDYEKEPPDSNGIFIESLSGYDSEYIAQLVL